MATVVSTVGTGTKEMTPYLVREFELTTILSDVSFTVTHGGPTSFKADKVEFEWRTPPTALCAATPYHDQANDTTTAISLKVVAENGGDLAGAVLRVRIYFYGGFGGGIS